MPKCPYCNSEIESLEFYGEIVINGFFSPPAELIQERTLMEMHYFCPVCKCEILGIRDPKDFFDPPSTH